VVSKSQLGDRDLELQATRRRGDNHRGRARTEGACISEAGPEGEAGQPFAIPWRQKPSSASRGGGQTRNQPIYTAVCIERLISVVETSAARVPAVHCAVRVENQGVTALQRKTNVRLNMQQTPLMANELNTTAAASEREAACYALAPMFRFALQPAFWATKHSRRATNASAVPPRAARTGAASSVWGPCFPRTKR